MTASEDQTQTFIGHVVFLDGFLRHEFERRLLALVARGLAPYPVDGAIAGGDDDPAGRRGRYAARRPAFERYRKRVLHCLLGERNVAELAHEHGHGAAVLVPEYLRDVLAQARTFSGFP